MTGSSEDELLALCREREARLAEAAARKYDDGEINPDGYLAIRSADL